MFQHARSRQSKKLSVGVVVGSQIEPGSTSKAVQDSQIQQIEQARALRAPKSSQPARVRAPKATRLNQPGHPGVTRADKSRQPKCPGRPDRANRRQIWPARACQVAWPGASRPFEQATRALQGQIKPARARLVAWLNAQVASRVQAGRLPMLFS